MNDARLCCAQVYMYVLRVRRDRLRQDVHSDRTAWARTCRLSATHIPLYCTVPCCSLEHFTVLYCTIRILCITHGMYSVQVLYSRVRSTTDQWEALPEMSNVLSFFLLFPIPRGGASENRTEAWFCSVLSIIVSIPLYKKCSGSKHCTRQRAAIAEWSIGSFSANQWHYYANFRAIIL